MLTAVCHRRASVCNACIRSPVYVCALFSQGSSAFCCNVKYSVFFPMLFSLYLSLRFRLCQSRRRQRRYAVFLFSIFVSSVSRKLFYAATKINVSSTHGCGVGCNKFRDTRTVHRAPHIATFVVIFSLKLRKSCLCRMVHPCTQRVGWERY